MDIKALYNEYVPWNIFQELLEIEYTLYDHLYQEEFFEDIDFEDLLKKEYHLLSELQTLSEKCNITRCSIPLVAKYIAALPIVIQLTKKIPIYIECLFCIKYEVNL